MASQRITTKTKFKDKMKKLIAILLIGFALTSCETDYKKDIEPEGLNGVEFKIDSTKWTPALVQIDGAKVTIYESGEMRDINVYDPMDTFFAGVLFGVIVVLFVGFIVATGD